MIAELSTFKVELSYKELRELPQANYKTIISYLKYKLPKEYHSKKENEIEIHSVLDDPYHNKKYIDLLVI